MADIIKQIQDISIEIDMHQLQQFRIAIDEFNAMVADGLTTHRGYNLQSIEQAKDIGINYSVATNDA